MNRIIVIGNGFDKAHGMKTGYRDFIDSYWTNVSDYVFNKYKRTIAKQFGVINNIDLYEDEFIGFQPIDRKQYKAMPKTPAGSDPYSQLQKFITDYIYRQPVQLVFKNQFFEHISSLCSLSNWVDIENEYYRQLKRLLKEDNAQSRNEKVRRLNQDFDAVKKLLEHYLTETMQNTEVTPYASIQMAFDSPVAPNEVANGKHEMFVESIIKNIIRLDKKDVTTEDKELDPNYLFCRTPDEEHRYYVMKYMHDSFFRKTHCTPDETLILNFNYTTIAENLYARKKDEIIHIHGELGSDRNPIIFGYGDELDDDYKEIEKLQDNDFLENIKSIRYPETGNYRRLLGFIESAPYQAFVMGHSCGNSDRTLLNTLFEHPNCMSVKVFYHLREDGTDDYSSLVRNLSRNFNDKAAMRDTVVNKKQCSPLVPASKNN